MAHALNLFELIWPKLQKLTNTLACVYIFVHVSELKLKYEIHLLAIEPIFT